MWKIVYQVTFAQSLCLDGISKILKRTSLKLLHFSLLLESQRRKNLQIEIQDKFLFVFKKTLTSLSSNKYCTTFQIFAWWQNILYSITFGTWQTVNIEIMIVMIFKVLCFWLPLGMALIIDPQTTMRIIKGTITMTMNEPKRL